MSEWKTIESAPRDGEAVLLWVPGFNTPDIGLWHEGIWVTPDDYFDITCPYGQPTHWMPLPESPT